MMQSGVRERIVASVREADRALDDAVDDLGALRGQLEELKPEVAAAVGEDPLAGEAGLEAKAAGCRARAAALEALHQRGVALLDETRVVVEALVGDLGALRAAMNTDPYDDDPELLAEAQRLNLRYVEEIWRTWHQALTSTLVRLLQFLREEQSYVLSQWERLDGALHGSEEEP